MKNNTEIPRISPVDPDSAKGNARKTLDQMKAKFGKHLNFFTTLANSPATLEGYTSLSRALAPGALLPRIREEIAVAISHENGCNYCKTAHGHAAVANGVEAADLPSLFEGQTRDGREQAAVEFAMQVLETKGNVANDDLAAIQAAGYSDEEILEIIAHVAMTFFSNALNNVSDPVVDLPALPIPSESAAV